MNEWPFKKPTTEEMREAFAAIDDHLRDRRHRQLAKLDEAAQAKSKLPCPYWGDAVHCYQPGRVGGMSGSFEGVDSAHLVTAKQCCCGARIRPTDYK